jgi:hypothetical protein
MASHLTRLGARQVTKDLDRIASLFQDLHIELGVPEKFALKFAYYCDVMSDHVERHADRVAKQAEEHEAEDEGHEAEEQVEAKSKSASRRSRKAAEDETGTSVDHGTSGFDANLIGDLKAGPLEILTPPSQPWMDEFFTQKKFQELRGKQQSGNIGFFVSASKARLQRMASVGSLGKCVDALKVLHAQLSASDFAEVRALAADVKKQAVAAAKLHDMCLAQQALGAVDLSCEAAADKVVQAVKEQVPHLQHVVSHVDESSPTALLELQQMIQGSSLKDLVSLGATIVQDALKDVTPVEKEAGVKLAGEDDSEDFEEDDDTDESEDDDTEESEDDSDDEDESDEGEGKTAAQIAKTLGYNLF